ncbi:MAG: aldo/keto reductase, partial [Myxococcales bacterium]|nr:aldo/keto reductase [Myxococcales bacterium]
APLAAGVLTGKYTRNAEADSADSLRMKANAARGRTSERALAIATAVDEVADRLGVSSAQVAMAWVMGQSYRYLPIVGARKVEQIRDTLGAGAVALDDEAMAKLAEVSKISLGFPHEFLASSGVRDLVHGEIRGRIDGRPKVG